MTISPGWYKDPAEPTTQRYWDGEGWLGAPLPLDATPPAGAPAPEAPKPPAQQVPTPAAKPAVVPVAPLLVPVRPHGLALATPGARLVARLIDIGAVLLLNAVINGWFVYKWLIEFVPYTQAISKAFYDGQSPLDVPRPAQMDNLLMVISVLAMAIWLAYEVPATAHSGQTLGKRAARIKVVRVESQEPLGFLRALRRWNPMGLPILLLYCCGPFLVILQILDVIFVAIDRMQRMALHDRSAGTYVVQLPGASGQKGR